MGEYGILGAYVATLTSEEARGVTLGNVLRAQATYTPD